MSTRRERLVAASMLKHFLNDRVVDQVDPVKFWEAELGCRVSGVQLEAFREIAQSIITAVDRLTEDEDSIRIEDMVEARRGARPAASVVEDRAPVWRAGVNPRHIKDPAAPLLRFPRFRGPVRAEVMVRDEVAREFTRRQSKGTHPSNGGK